MFFERVFPHAPLFLDASWTDFFTAAQSCIYSAKKREDLIERIKSMWTTKQNPNLVLPSLSVRTVFDMYLRIMNFPEGSEVIMSAINIPDMSSIVHYHKLKIVSLDINLDDISPKLELFEALVTPRTKLVLVAHIYGKWFDMAPLLDLTEKHGIPLIEDCAEGFHGFVELGNPRSDLALFSFGTIKYCTSFGGAIAKVRDKKLYEQLQAMQLSYSYQSHREYLKKILKYSLVRTLINVPTVTRAGFGISHAANFDVQQFVVKLSRGFAGGELIRRIRQQPCTALLATMQRRHSNYRSSDNLLSIMKGEYMTQRLPENAFPVGQKAVINNYWLFPIIVEHPAEVVRHLVDMGVFAYRGATQLNLVEPDITPTQQPLPSPNSSADNMALKEHMLNVNEKLKSARQVGHREGEGTNVGESADWTEMPGGPKGNSVQAWGKSPGENEGTFKISKQMIGDSTKKDLPHSQHSTSHSNNSHSPLQLPYPPQESQLKIHGMKCNQNGGTDSKWDQAGMATSKKLKKYFQQFPHEAKYLMDHVVYLPVNRLVPFTQLDRLAECVTIAVEKSMQGKRASNHVNYKLKLKSNL